MVPNSAPPCAGFDAFGHYWESDPGRKVSLNELEIEFAGALREDPQLRTDLEAAKAIYCGDMTFSERRFFAQGLSSRASARESNRERHGRGDARRHLRRSVVRRISARLPRRHGCRSFGVSAPYAEDAMIETKEKRKLLVDLPRQHIKAGEIGDVLADYPISKTLCMRFGARYVTVRSDQVGPVEEVAS